MPVVLHKLDGSPPCRAVLMVIEIIGLKVETKEVNTLTGDQFKPEFLALSPLHTIPVIEDGDFVLADSHAIITYLVSKYGGDKRAQLYPSDLRVRATVDQRLYLDTSTLFPKLRDVIVSVLKDKKPGPSVEQTAAIEEAYGFLDTYLQKSPNLVTEHITLADVSIVASVSSLDIFVPVNEKYPKLYEWFERIKEQAWYQKCNQPGLTILANVCNQVMKKS